jgi:hypothetical protein
VRAGGREIGFILQFGAAFWRLRASAGRYFRCAFFASLPEIHCKCRVAACLKADRQFLVQ